MEILCYTHTHTHTHTHTNAGTTGRNVRWLCPYQKLLRADVCWYKIQWRLLRRCKIYWRPEWVLQWLSLTVVRQARYVWRNSEARLWNKRCRGKTVLFISLGVFALGACLCVCVCTWAWAKACEWARVALLTQHAKRMRSIILSYATCLCSTVFFRHYPINGSILGERLLNMKCVFLFSLQFLVKTFLTLRRIQQDIVINVKTYWLFLSCFSETWTFSIHFRKRHKYRMLLKFVHWKSSCSTCTDRHEEPNIRKSKVKLSRYRPEQAHGRSGRLRPRIFLTFGTWRL